MRGAPAVALALAGCLEVPAFSLVLDLDRGVGELRLRDLRSAPDAFSELDAEAQARADHQELVARYLEGGELGDGWSEQRIRAWEVTSRALEVRDGRLDGVVAFRFARDGLSLDSHSSALPVRWCPPDGLRVTASNATAREANGCVGWAAEVRVLRVESERVMPSEGRSLAPFHEDAR